MTTAEVLPEPLRQPSSYDDLMRWGRSVTVTDQQFIAVLRQNNQVGVLALTDLAREGRVPADVLRSRVHDLWQYAGWPEGLLPRETWIGLADLAGTRPVGGQYMKRLTLFRGSNVGTGPSGTDPSIGLGMSWTTSEHRASHYGFARQEGVVYRAQMSPVRILWANYGCSGGQYCRFNTYVVDTLGMGVDVHAEAGDAMSGIGPTGLWPAPRRRSSLCSCRRPEHVL